MMIAFTVPGKPQGKARPRFNRKCKKPYTPKRTSEYEELVKASYLQSSCKRVKLTGEIKARINAYFPIPKSETKERRLKMLGGWIKPTVKPDADNIIKAVLDALNGYAYKDDAAVVSVTATKEYSEYPRVDIVLEGDVESS